MCVQNIYSIVIKLVKVIIPRSYRGKNINWCTCTATAKPSARRDDVNQTCKQGWNAAIGIGPNLAANEAAKVMQNVTAITLVIKRPPVIDKEIENKI